MKLQTTLRRAFRSSRRAASALYGVLRRSENRSARLRTECYLKGRLPPPERRPPGSGGTAGALRQAWEELESLGEQYRRREGDPGQGRRFKDYGEQCRRDARSVHDVLDRLMR